MLGRHRIAVPKETEIVKLKIIENREIDFSQNVK